MGTIVNLAEAIAVGDVIIPRMPQSGQRPCHDDAFAIIQVFPRGLTPHGGNTQKIWNRSEKIKKQPGPCLVQIPIQICYYRHHTSAAACFFSIFSQPTSQVSDSIQEIPLRHLQQPIPSGEGNIRIPLHHLVGSCSGYLLMYFLPRSDACSRH